MTFLEICRELARLCSIPGTNVPVSVSGQTGELERVVKWAAQAWLDIELRHPRWNFMIKEFGSTFGPPTAGFQTVPGQAAYTKAQQGATNIRVVDRRSLRVFETAVGRSSEQWLVDWDFQVYRDTYDFQNGQPPGQPVIFATRPEDKAILLAPTPDKAYTVTGRYWRQGAKPTADGDVPAFPEEFHQLIVYRAMLKYAGYEAAGDAKQTALEEYGPLMRALERDQLPELGFGEPLA